MPANPYANLSPDTILDAIESKGLLASGHLSELNSYENRVYLIGIEDHPDVVAKFYRPGRWSEQQILQEHNFTFSLEQDDIPVVSPLKINGKSLHCYKDYFFTLFPKRSGHPLELDNLSQLEQTGRMLARLHSVGHRCDLSSRILMSPDQMGWQARQTLLESEHLPSDMKPSYESASQHLLDQVTQIWSRSSAVPIAIHGDLHPGNILYRDGNIWLVDFDDCIRGPAIQDIWMLLSGDLEQQQEQLDAVMSGYHMFNQISGSELQLIECCRALRIINYAAWLAKRWHDPAFPKAFPWFAGHRFWSEHINQLMEQLALVQQPSPLVLR